MYAETPRRIVLVGNFGAVEANSLADYCVRLHGNGHVALMLDMVGIADCDLAGLEGLVALSGDTGIPISVTGARWGQFMNLLSAASIADVQRLCDDVRGLVGSTREHLRNPGPEQGPGPARGDGRHSATSADGGTSL